MRAIIGTILSMRVCQRVLMPLSYADASMPLMLRRRPAATIFADFFHVIEFATSRTTFFRNARRHFLRWLLMPPCHAAGHLFRFDIYAPLIRFDTLMISVYGVTLSYNCIAAPLRHTYISLRRC